MTQGNSLQRWMITAIGLVVVIVVAGGAWLWKAQERRLRQSAEDGIKSIAQRIPLDQRDVAAVKAVEGLEGVVQGKDYRGVDVVAALKAVPDSSWFLVSKMEVEEMLADWPARSMLIATVINVGLVLRTGDHRRHLAT